MPRGRKTTEAPARHDAQGWGVAEEGGDVIDISTGEVLDTPPLPPPDAPIDEEYRPLAVQHFEFKPTELKITGHPTFEEWAGMGEMIRTFVKGIQWMAGDWLAFGQGEFGDRYDQVVSVERWSHSTVRNFIWVATKVPPENRRIELEWSHHQAVAHMTTTEQAIWLQRAVDNGWSVNELKAALKEHADGDSSGPGAEPATQYGIYIACESMAKQAEVARQLTNLGVGFELKNKTIH